METKNPDAKPERETGKTEKQGGESQKGPAAAPHVEGPPHSEAKAQDADKGRDETDGEEDKAFNKLADAEAEQTKWERMQGEWTRIGAVTTAALGLATFLLLFHQTCTLSKQLEAMQSSSNDTQKMIVAMQQQANASQNTADRQRDIAEQMGRQANASINAANAATTQAAASQTQANASVAQAEVAKQSLGAIQSSARAAESSAQVATQGARPYLDMNAQLLFFQDQQPAIEIHFINEGNSPADVRARYEVTIRGSVSYEGKGVIEPFIVLPRKYASKSIVGINKKQIDAVIQNNAHIRLKLTGYYIGVGGSTPIAWCVSYAKNRGASHLDLAQPCDVTEE